eukprot:COSAG06_NODE_11131_length_1562_cov_0.914559_2_plen_204_part_00
MLVEFTTPFTDKYSTVHTLTSCLAPSLVTSPVHASRTVLRHARLSRQLLLLEVPEPPLLTDRVGLSRHEGANQHRKQPNNHNAGQSKPEQIRSDQSKRADENHMHPRPHMMGRERRGEGGARGSERRRGVRTPRRVPLPCRLQRPICLGLKPGRGPPLHPPHQTQPSHCPCHATSRVQFKNPQPDRHNTRTDRATDTQSTLRR